MPDKKLAITYYHSTIPKHHKRAIMEQYKQKIFDYLATEENFKLANSMANYLKEFKIQAIADFWPLVEVKLKERLKIEKDDFWSVHITGSFTNDYTRLEMYNALWCTENEDFPLMSVAIEKLGRNNSFYGVWVNSSKEYSPKYDLDRVRKEAQQLEVAKGFTIDKHQYWPFWKHSNLNFDDENDMIRILPANRQATIDEIAESLYALAKEVKDDMVKFSNYKL